MDARREQCCWKVILRVIRSDKNVRGDMERIHRLWIERGGREMTKQRLRTKAQNIEKKKLFSDVQIGEIFGTGTTEDDVEAMIEKSDEVHSDLEVAIEEEQNRVDVAEVCVSVESCVDVCWQGKEIRLLKDEEKKVLKRLREVMLISEKNQLPSLRKVNATCCTYCTLGRTWLLKSLEK